MPAGEPETVALGPQLGGHPHLGYLRVRMSHAQEHQPQRRPTDPQLVDRVHQRQRIEPVVHAAAPDQHRIRGPDLGKEAAQRSGFGPGGSGSMPKGTTATKFA